MQRCWLISEAVAEGTGLDEIATILEQSGFLVVERGVFPHHAMPTSSQLRSLEIDIVALVVDSEATIDLATTALEGWEGTMLLLPHGNSGRIIRHLHGTATTAEIARRAGTGRRARLPYLEIGRHRAFVALVVGPSAAWAGKLEAPPKGLVAKLTSGFAFLRKRALSRGISLFDGTRAMGRHQAVVLTPSSNGMDVSMIRLSSWIEIGRIGLRGLEVDGHSPTGAETSRASQLTIASGAPLHALFDGERAELRSPAHVARRTTKLAFLSTLEPAAPRREEKRRRRGHPASVRVD